MTTAKNKEVIQKRLVYLSILLFSCVLFISSVKTAFSQEKIPLAIAPSRQTIAVDPGQSQSGQVKFFNSSDSPISGNIKVVDFVVTGKDGSPLLLEESTNPYVILPFNKASIASGGVLNINFQVKVPSSETPGGRYAAIIFEQTGQIQEASDIGNQSASAVFPRIVGLINIRINGPVTESAFVDLFKLPTFLEFGPIPVYFEIINKGGYHILPRGELTLKNWFGKEVESVIIDEKNIFPNTRRYYDSKLGSTLMFGRYEVSLNASYGEGGKSTVAQGYVWALPITLIILIILTGLIIGLSIYLITKKLRQKQEILEEKLEKEISEIEALKMKFKDRLPKS